MTPQAARSSRWCWGDAADGTVIYDPLPAGIASAFLTPGQTLAQLGLSPIRDFVLNDFKVGTLRSGVTLSHIRTPVIVEGHQPQRPGARRRGGKPGARRRAFGQPVVVRVRWNERALRQHLAPLFQPGSGRKSRGGGGGDDGVSQHRRGRHARIFGPKPRRSRRDHHYGPLTRWERTALFQYGRCR